MPKHILIIGKSPAVLESAAASLRAHGHEVVITDDFDKIAERFDLRQIDLITTGGQVPVDTRAQIRRDAKKLKSDMLFVQGLAGIPGLIVQQIEGEFAAEHRDTEHPPMYVASPRSIKLFLKNAADVQIACWWQTTFTPPNPGSDSRVLIDKRLPAGEHSVPLPADIPKQASFATVQVDKAIYSFSLNTVE